MQNMSINELNAQISQLIQQRNALISSAEAANEEGNAESFSSAFEEASNASGPNEVSETPHSQSYLLEDGKAAGGERPNSREFQVATGASDWDTSEALYGVVGSNTDLRDWKKIMASDDPLQAAREATRQMYEKSGDVIANEKTIAKFDSENVVAEAGPLKLIQDGERQRIYLGS